MVTLAKYQNMAVIISSSNRFTNHKQNKSSPWQHTTRHEMNVEGSPGTIFSWANCNSPFSLTICENRKDAVSIKQLNSVFATLQVISRMHFLSPKLQINFFSHKLKKTTLATTTSGQMKWFFPWILVIQSTFFSKTQIKTRWWKHSYRWLAAAPSREKVQSQTKHSKENWRIIITPHWPVWLTSRARLAVTYFQPLC